ncbi:MAG: MauE/DoxX family redox-associated membrane protein [Planctomycetota bacterium]
MKWLFRISYLCGAFVAVSLIVAGLLKLSDVASFAATLRGWQTIPAWSVGLISTSLPGTELAAGLAYFLSPTRRWVICLVAMLLSALTVGYAIELTRGAAPDCGCFGKLSAWIAFRESGLAVIARNGGLLLMTILAAPSAWRCKACGRLGHHGVDRSHGSATRVPAFTLLETVVVITVIGVLLAILLPVVRVTRDRADELVVQANLRTHASVFHAYANDNGGYFPQLGQIPHDRSASNADPLLAYQSQVYSWGGSLAGDYYGGSKYHPAFDVPRVRSGEVSLYEYSASFIFRPEFWSLKTRNPSNLAYGATRPDEVVFPSRKVLHSNWSYDGTDHTWPSRTHRGSFSLADGSADSATNEELYPGLGGGVTTASGSRVGLSLWTPGQTTKDGVRGYDLP